MNETANVAVIYYSATGNVHGLARALASGAEEVGAVRRFGYAPWKNSPLS